MRESWADRGQSGTNYDVRCWTCDNYTLNNTAITKPSNSDTMKMANYAQNLVDSSSSKNVEAQYKSESGVRHEMNAVIEYSSHTFTFKKSS